MPRPLRVYLLITELEPAGAERVLYQIATGLDRERFTVRVGALQGGGSVGSWLHAAGVPVFAAGARRGHPIGYPAAFIRLVRDLRSFRPDLLHTHLFHAGLAGRLAAPLAGVPRLRLVSHVHIVEGRPLPARHAFDRLTRALVDVEVCVSAAVARHRRTATGTPARQLRVIYNGVDLERARSSEIVTKVKGAMRLRTGIAKDDGEARTPVVLALGRLDRQKGFDVLIEAAALLRRSVPEATVAIAGEGRERDDLERRIAAHGLTGKVVLHGHREDIGRYLAAADVLAMPSRWEGFGLAAVEAMAAGLPVVASAVDSLPELIEDGVTGRLVPAEDPAALAAALAALLRDPATRARMGEAGRVAAERFGIPAMIAQVSALYAGLCGARQSAHL